MDRRWRMFLHAAVILAGVIALHLGGGLESTSRPGPSQPVAAESPDSGTILVAGRHVRLAVLPAAPAGGDAVVPHPLTVSTDLTQPSGESAAALDAFLEHTALAGLGNAFVTAEATYHVSARYLVAHAIEESHWGTSGLAQDKHNLFGYGADDLNPYGHAHGFPSFQACIDYVASKVAAEYLSPEGIHFNGPTLRGMHAHYATDPRWAANIVEVARVIP
ncbi:MAG: glucosaminidase domain-containing protein [Candidatus Dormibacteria bacterium]